MAAPPPYWTPTATDIETLERFLPDFLALSGEAAKSDILPKLRTYARQYLGYTINGERRIYVNALCPFYWQRDPVGLDKAMAIVADGGVCYFQVHFDPVRQSFERLAINGVA